MTFNDEGGGFQQKITYQASELWAWPHVCASLSLNMTARAATTFAFSLVKLPAVATMTMYDVLRGATQTLFMTQWKYGTEEWDWVSMKLFLKWVSIVKQFQWYQVYIRDPNRAKKTLYYRRRSNQQAKWSLGDRWFCGSLSELNVSERWRRRLSCDRLRGESARRTSHTAQ